MEKEKRFNQKGIITDAVFIIQASAIILVVLLFSVVIFTQLKAGILTLNVSGIDEANASMQQFDQGFVTFDKLILPLFIVGLIIGLIITSMLIPSHPIFIVINIFGMIFLVFLGVVMRYIYESISADSVVSASISSLTFSPLVAQYLPFIGFVAILIGTIVGYSKGGEF